MTKDEALKAIDLFYQRDKDAVDAFNNTLGHKGVEMHAAFLSDRVNDAISTAFVLLKWLIENTPER